MIDIKDKNLYYIGGVVRDEILGIKSFDTDLTYQGDAIDFCKNLENNKKLKIIQINEPFGTVKVLINGQEVDIASTRDEIYLKKGHLPTVSDIGCDLKKDVLRRDFTINALAKSTENNNIIDYTGGLSDIKNKKLKVLHDNSFIDDPTRIIRGLKFAVRFNFELDEHTKFLQEEYLKNVNYDMSYKRLKKELMETFNLNSQAAYNKFFDEKMYKLLTKETLAPTEYNIQKLVEKYPVDNIWLVYMGLMDLSVLPLTSIEKKIIDDYKFLLNTEIPYDDYSIYKNFEDRQRESILLYTISTNSNKGLRFFDIEHVKINLNGNDLIKLGIEPSDSYSKCFDFILKNKLKNPDMTTEDEISLAEEFFNLQK